MQFTLKTLMAAVLVTALLCGVFFALPGWLSVLVLLFFWAMAPPALITGIVYGRGYGRAFSIGCVSTGGCVPLIWIYGSMIAVSLLGEGSIDLDDETTATAKIAFGVLFVLVGLSGLIGMAVRWLSLRMAPQEQSVATAPYSVLQSRVTVVDEDQPEKSPTRLDRFDHENSRTESAEP